MEINTAIEIMNRAELFGEAYDRDPQVGEAMNLLVPGFEYPDFSGKECWEILLDFFKKKKKPVELGRHVVTSGIHNEMNSLLDVTPFFARHAMCDFGDLEEEDTLENFIAIELKEGRIFSQYVFNGRKIFVITDFEVEDEEEDFCQQRTTTIMFCDEY